MGLSSERRHRLVSVPATKQKRNFDRSLPKSQVSSTVLPVHPQREGLSPDSPTPAGKVPACFAQRMSAGRCRPDPCWGSTQDHEIRSEAACTQSVESVREKGKGSRLSTETMCCSTSASSGNDGSPGSTRHPPVPLRSQTPKSLWR